MRAETTAINNIPALVIVGGVEEERGPGAIFNQFPWQLCRMPGRIDFTTRAPGIHPRVVVCERELPDGNWKDILETAWRMEDPPPLIVTSRLADDHLWAEVLNLGGYDVLAKPLDRREVDRVVTLAWDYAARHAGLKRRVRREELRSEGQTKCSTASMTR